MHVFDPHAPYAPPPPFDRQYADSPYAGEVAFTDSALGPLLDAARDASGRPTLVIVTGDHGEGLGDHGELTHGLFAYEATLRIPLIVAQIDRRTPSFSAAAACSFGEPSRVSTIAARHVDIVPTVLDALGLPKPAEPAGPHAAARSRGRGLRSRGRRTSRRCRTMFNRGWAPLTGVLVDRDKYIDLPLPELYDLGGDPAEASNLAGRQPDRQRTLESQAPRPSGPRRRPRGRPRTPHHGRDCRRLDT